MNIDIEVMEEFFVFFFFVLVDSVVEFLLFRIFLDFFFSMFLYDCVLGVEILVRISVSRIVGN